MNEFNDMTMLEDSSAPIANIATGFAAGLRTLRLRDQVVGAGMIVICVDGLPSRPEDGEGDCATGLSPLSLWVKCLDHADQ